MFDNLKNTKKVIKYYKYLILGVLISVFSFVIKSDDYDFLNGLSNFVLRVVSSGDNYYMALPNDTWKNVTTGPWYSHLFLGLLGRMLLYIDYFSNQPRLITISEF